MSTAQPLDRIGVGIDTARYGHRVSFLRPDRQPAAKPLTVLENRSGYQALQQRLQHLHQQHPKAHFHIHLDAAGQYAANLEHFLRRLPLPITLSIGEPKRNKDYQKAHFPKRTSDDTESQAMARFAVVELPQATPPLTAPLILLREVAGRLQAQVKQSTQALNRLHNLLARTFPELTTLIEDLSASWVLQLLDHYPTAQRLGHARFDSIKKIPHLSEELALQVHLCAQHSVASLSGEVAETLMRDLVKQVRHTQAAEAQMRRTLQTAYAALPASPHRQIETIPGIGMATAAVLVAQAVDVQRFATPAAFVGYFGVFPEENSSGVDKSGNPLPSGMIHMSRKGNDLVRHYLWNAARTGLRFNPVISALYHRLKAKGKRGDVALGHCMAKLLHLVYAVWQSDKPFDATARTDKTPPTSPASPPPAEAPATPAPPTHPSCGKGTASPGLETAAAGERPSGPSPCDKEPAVGPKPDEPTAGGTEALSPPPGKAASSSGSSPPPERPSLPSNRPAARPKIDFAYLREQVSLEQVLRHLGVFEGLRGRGLQRRGSCPIHGKPDDRQPTFSAHLGKNIFRCFHADCGAQGNVLDLWMAVHKRPLYEAALHLAETFGVPRNREEGPVKRTH